jgi:hypothetical protein
MDTPEFTRLLGAIIVAGALGACQGNDPGLFYQGEIGIRGAGERGPRQR